MPARQVKATLQFFANPDGVFVGQHQRYSTIELRLRGRNGGRRGMPGHGSGVAQAEIDVAMSVDIKDFGAVSLAYERGECAGPLGHPIHGNAAEEGFVGAVEERFGFGARTNLKILKIDPKRRRAPLAPALQIGTPDRT